MEVQNVPLEPQPDAQSIPSIQAQPIGQSTIPPTSQPQPLPPEPLPVEPQPVLSVPTLAPTPLPSQPSSPPSKKLFLFFGLIIIVLFLVGFGGAWAYSRFFKSKQNTILDRQRVNPVTFSAIAPNTYTEEQAIGAIKKAYSELKDIQSYDDRGTPRTFIRSLQTKTGWKLRFNRGYGECGGKYDGCQREQYYYFTVTFDGNVTKVGEVELIQQPDGTDQVNGTRVPNFFKEDTQRP